MKEIKAYLEIQFRQLPNTRYYRQLKKSIFLDCTEKYDGYVKQYGTEAERKIIEEIGNWQDLYRGDFYLRDWINIITIVSMVMFLIFLLLIKADAKDLSNYTMSLDANLFNMPVYFILMFPKYFTGIIISYVVCNLFHYFKPIVFKKTIVITLLRLLMICLWIITVLLLIQVMFGYFFTYPVHIYNEYIIKHGVFSSLFDVILGSLLGFSTGYFITNKRNRIKCIK